MGMRKKERVKTLFFPISQKKKQNEKRKSKPHSLTFKQKKKQTKSERNERRKRKPFYSFQLIE